MPRARGPAAWAPPLRSADGAFLFLVEIEVKYAQVSSSPKRARSVAPLTFVLPPVPITFAVTIRGDTPRRMTRMPFKRPLTSPSSLLAALAMLMRIGRQRCLGETPSYGSLTDFSHGLGSLPVNEFSTFSVRPPDVEKKYVTTGAPSYVTTCPRVAATAAFVDA